ncbi:MAG TPA: hypothetical protein VNC50_02520 [Planctomycetia bacterium]|nr:hypothetical protein [Planctomycetia bacterium]
MSKNAPKSSVVAFKVEEELAVFLNGLPNKSDFIRRAIHAQLGIACPLCRGTGKVSKETHDHFTVFLEKWELHSCEGCGDEFAVPKGEESKHDLPVPVQAAVDSIRSGGPEYCYTCFPTSEKEDG